MPARLLTALLIGLALLPAASGAQDAPPAFVPQPCAFKAPDGINVDCGYVVVPEDRASPDGPGIRLPVAIFHSVSETPAPDPVVLLVGGPGGQALEYPDYTFRPNYAEFLKTRDFILYEQRGVGTSRPSLDCPGLERLYPAILGQPRTPDEALELEYQALGDCRETLERRGLNLNAYSSAISAADLDDLRRALGYETWNLLGVSYGSRLALTALRDRPEGIRSVILDSVYPLQVNLFETLAPHQQQAFERLFAACAADAACSENFPDLPEVFYSLVERLNAEPLEVRLPGRVYINGDLVANMVFNRLYRADEIPRIPQMIYGIRDGQMRWLRPMIEDYLGRSYGLSEGFYYTVQCGEEVSFSTLDRALEAGAALEARLRPGYERDMRGLYALCERWGAPAAAPYEDEAVTSDIPALVLSGQFDPITPPEWGRLAADTLENGHFFEFPGVGHGVVRSNACGLQMTLAFLDDPTRPPDDACIAALPGMTFETP
ncbi:MAG: alpha/beta hydrolase [Chloroflexota bacterium]|nr:MAG: alpha/beta hydrolase [Chloroflexota bacterium]